MRRLGGSGKIRYHWPMSLLNDKQRAGLAGTVAAMALVLLLHCPIRGYETGISMRNPYPFTPSPQCQAVEGIHSAKATYEEKVIKQQCVRIASEAMYFTHDLHLSQWRSQAAMTEWFALLGNVLTAEGALLAFGVVTTWGFRTRRAPENAGAKRESPG